MSSMIVESSKSGKYFLSVDYYDNDKEYINSKEEIEERMQACLDIYDSIKTSSLKQNS